MQVIINTNTNPFFNLALEEYLLETVTTQTFMLWRNEKSVIVGVNQNTVAEVNREQAEQNDIKIVRRLTGGGAVFHDLGNINFTYIEDASNNNFNKYKYFTKDLQDFLSLYGIKAELSGRNDILIKGKKISGNAQCIKNNNLMHHGCILYSADLSELSKVLNVNNAKIESKGIKSVISRVSNVKDYMKNKLQAEEFMSEFTNFICERYGVTPINLDQKQIDGANKKAIEKYSTYNWNFGSSPDYNYRNEIKFSFGVVELYLSTKNSVITDAKIKGDFFGILDINGLEQMFIGCNHCKQDLYLKIGDVNIDSYITGCTKDDIIKLF